MSKYYFTVTSLLFFALASCSNDDAITQKAYRPSTPVNAATEIRIGSQVWMKNNLAITTYTDGTPIPQVTNKNTWAGLTTGAWCYYNNDPAMGTIYGKLYNWYAVAGIYNAASLANPSLRKQFAPIGWHVPNEVDWFTLLNYLDPSSAGGYHEDNTAGCKMKETGLSHWVSPNTGATNSSGFTGLPAGERSYTGDFIEIGSIEYWWCSIEIDDVDALTRSVYSSLPGSLRTYRVKQEGLSVRCIKN